MKRTNISVTGPVRKPYKVALVSDVHNIRPRNILIYLSSDPPDYILINGDLLYAGGKNRSIYDYDPESGQHLRNAENAQILLQKAVKIAPVIFSTGNHELYLDDKDKSILADLGVCFLDNDYQRFGDLIFGGLSSPYKIFAGTGVSKTKEEHKRRWEMVFENVNTVWLDDFERQDGYKVLLCHHPEFYEPFLKKRPCIDLIVSGHAHGGQIRLFGRGLFAYGQGFLPKYTSGIYDNRLIISRGLSNTSKVPRLFNSTEIVYIDLMPRNSELINGG